MTRKRLLGIGVAITLLAAALGTGLVIAQQEGGNDESTEVKLSPLASPTLLDFQGRLSDTSGTPVPDGVYEVITRIYDAPTGGVLLYSESHPSVATTGGFFSLTLGDVAPLAQALFDQSPLYIGVEVGADGEMAPRIPVNSVPYAFRADVAASSPWAGLGVSPRALPTTWMTTRWAT